MSVFRSSIVLFLALANGMGGQFVCFFVGFYTVVHALENCKLQYLNLMLGSVEILLGFFLIGGAIWLRRLKI